MVLLNDVRCANGAEAAGPAPGWRPRWASGRRRARSTGPRALGGDGRGRAVDRRLRVRRHHRDAPDVRRVARDEVLGTPGGTASEDPWSPPTSELLARDPRSGHSPHHGDPPWRDASQRGTCARLLPAGDRGMARA